MTLKALRVKFGQCQKGWCFFFFFRYAKKFESAFNLICFLLCNLSVFIMSLFFFLMLCRMGCLREVQLPGFVLSA